MCNEIPPRQRWHSATRSGFTLIELLIALVLLDAGLLALVGIANGISRNTLQSRSASNALSTASARLERMASIACNGTRSGTEHIAPGITERYSDAPGPNDTRIITDSVSFFTSRGPRAIVLRTGARC